MADVSACARNLLSRRAIVMSAAAALVAPRARAAGGLPVFKVGFLPFGTVQWEIKTLVDNGFDTKSGIKVEMLPLASSDAARIAFLSGTVDTIVQDLFFAARLKADGKSVLYLPESTTEGELITSLGSPIRGVADLKGKSIGVAGGPIDKNWIFLRAAALQQAKLDLTRDAHPVFGAPPLLAAKVETGELDCGLLYWSTAARIKAKGYREVTSTEAVLASLGAKGKIAVTGYVFKGDGDRRVLAAFAKALRQTEQLLATSDDAWTRIRPLMKAPDDATFEALKAGVRRGIPHKPRDAEIADARAFFSIVKEVGGAPLLGPTRDLPDDLYVDQAIYG